MWMTSLMLLQRFTVDKNTMLVARKVYKRSCVYGTLVFVYQSSAPTHWLYGLLGCMNVYHGQRVHSDLLGMLFTETSDNQRSLKPIIASGFICRGQVSFNFVKFYIGLSTLLCRLT